MSRTLLDIYHVSNESNQCRQQGPSWIPRSRSTDYEIPSFYGTRSDILVFMRASRWALSLANWAQSKVLHPINLRAILIYLPYFEKINLGL
jgi:hypothetical protein